MSTPFVPVPRSLLLCDSHASSPDGRVNLTGIFRAIRPAIYPHVRGHFVVFAQLTGASGDVPFHFEVCRERDDELVRQTVPRTIHFPSRVAVVSVAMVLEGVRFPEPGVYVVSLFCHNTWVCDTVLDLV